MRILTTAGLTALLFLSAPTAAADDRPSVRACVGYEVADREYTAAVKAAGRVDVQARKAELKRIDEELEATSARAKRVAGKAIQEAHAAAKAGIEQAYARTSSLIASRTRDAERIFNEAIARADAIYGSADDAARASGEAQRVRREAVQAAGVAFRSARDAIWKEEFAKRDAAVDSIDEPRNRVVREARRTVRTELDRARRAHRSARERVFAPYDEAKAAAETAREAAYAAAYGLDAPSPSGGSRRVAARLRDRHKTLCDQVLSLRHPALARGESKPPLALCTRYAEADEVYDEEEAAADAAFHAEKRRIFISHYPEYASDPDRPRHLIGERVRAFNEEVERVAQAPRAAAKKAARDKQGDAYTAIFADAGPAFPLIDGFKSMIIVRHRGLCRRYQRM